MMKVARSGIWTCASCGFQSSELQSGAGTGIDGLEALRRRNFEILLARIENIRPLQGLKLLEVGCAKGWFLKAARQRGAECFGIEPEEANAAMAREEGYHVETAFFPGSASAHGPFDLIVFNDVLEHIPSPDDVMRTTASLLATGGMAVVNLPSSDGVLYRLASLSARMGQDELFWRMWQRGFSSPHISYFNPTNLRMMVERHTPLREVDTFPLKTVSRRGLRDRIRSSHGGPVGEVLFGGMWTLSFVLDYLPPDIHVGVFEKAAEDGRMSPVADTSVRTETEAAQTALTGEPHGRTALIDEGGSRGA